MPDDVAALTWDALGLVKQAILNTGGLSGDIKKDRSAVRDQTWPRSRNSRASPAR